MSIIAAIFLWPFVALWRYARYHSTQRTRTVVATIRIPPYAGGGTVDVMAIGPVDFCSSPTCPCDRQKLAAPPPLAIVR